MHQDLKPIDCSGRIESVISHLDSALLVGAGPQMRWLCGFAGSYGWLVAGHDRAVIIVDGRYKEIAQEQIALARANVEIIELRDHALLWQRIAEQASGGEIALIESDTCIATFSALRSATGKELRAVSDPTADFRRVKSPQELARIEIAARCADTALGNVCCSDWRGLTERQLAARIEIEIRAAGADRESFETIVASGPNGSKAHHSPSDRMIEDGDAVIVDMGAMIDGYRSDMTRTFFVGTPDPLLVRGYEVVLEAQEAGVRALGAGVALADVDLACREVLRNAGLEDYFITGTGHGIGLEIHETPFIGSRATGAFVVGDTVTVEPGIYPEGVGGIRIEDTVFIDSSGPRRLTLSSKEPSCPR